MSSPSTQAEEEKLRRKLSELAGNLSDKGLSSDDEAVKKPFPLGKGSSGTKPVVPLDSLKNKDLSSSSDEMPTEAQKVQKLHPCQQFQTVRLTENMNLKVQTWQFQPDKELL